MPNQVDLRELAVERQQSPPSLANRRRHWLSRYVIPIGLIVGFVLVIAWALRDAFLPAQAVMIVPVQVTRAEFQQEGTPLFKSAGWVEPRPTPFRVAALAAGVIKELRVVEDQALNPGDVIATLVDEDAVLNLERAKAELDQATALKKEAQTRYDSPVHLEAPLANAESMLAAVEKELAKLPFEITSANARLRLADEDLKRKEAAKGAVSDLTIEKSRRESTAAKAVRDECCERETRLQRERQALLNQRDALKSQLDLKASETRAVEESKASVKLAQIAVDEAQLRMDRMTVRSPIEGRVLRLLSSPGTHLQGGSGRGEQHEGGVVVSMYQPKQLQVRVDVRFEDLPLVVRGQEVLIESPAVSRPMTGKVLFLSSLADIQKNTLEVKVAIEDPPQFVKPEMLVDVTFLAPKQSATEPGASERERIFVPKQFLHPIENGTFVWIADSAAGIARRVSIVTGQRGTNVMIEVVEGLDVASKLIALPHDKLHDGARIKILGEAAE